MMNLTNIEKGIIGENNIYNQIIDNIDIYHKVIRNIYITNENGLKTEIDLILITSVGIFVIESKNFTGYICNSLNSNYWLQIICKNKIFPFSSPIKQNEYHILFLKNNINVNSEYLVIDNNYFSSYIVFGHKTKLKKTFYFNNIKVLLIDDLIKQITIDIIKRPIILSHEEVDKIYFTLNHLSKLQDITLEDLRS